MSTDEMIKKAGYAGFRPPMNQLNAETLVVYDPDTDDVAFLRFVEDHIYVYKYSHEADVRPRIY